MTTFPQDNNINNPGMWRSSTPSDGTYIITIAKAVNADYKIRKEILSAGSIEIKADSSISEIEVQGSLDGVNFGKLYDEYGNVVKCVLATTDTNLKIATLPPKVHNVPWYLLISDSEADATEAAKVWMNS
jgi:hypothetical protein